MTSAPASTASTTPGPTTAAYSRRRSPCPESATRERRPALSPSAQSRTRQRRPAPPRLPPGVAGNSNPAQPESIVTNEAAAARLSGVLLYVLLHCCTAVLGRSVGRWWVVGGWWMAARFLPEMAEYRQKMKFPPFVSCFIQGPQEPTNCSTCTRCTAVRTAALLYVVKVSSVGGWRVHCVVRGGWVGRSVRGSLFSSCGR